MFALPSLRALSKKPPPPPPPPTPNVTPGFEGIYGTAGLTLIYSGNIDDSYFAATIPFTFNFFGTNYGNNNNGGIYIGSNGYITFGVASSQFSSYSPSSPGRALHFLSADRRLYEFQAGSMSRLKGVDRYRIYWRGTSYSNNADNFTVEIIFYSNNNIQLNYGTVSGISSTIQGLSNGSSYTNTWSVTSSSVSLALGSNASGTAWTVSNGYWA